MILVNSSSLSSQHYKLAFTRQETQNLQPLQNSSYSQFTSQIIQHQTDSKAEESKREIQQVMDKFILLHVMMYNYIWD